MSGEEATGAKTAAIDTTTSFLGGLLDPSVGGRSGLGNGGNANLIAANGHYARLAYNGQDDSVPMERPARRALTVWGDIQGAHHETDADKVLGTHDTTATQYGGELGLDYTPGNGEGAIGLRRRRPEELGSLPDTGKGRAEVYQVFYHSRRLIRTIDAASYGQHKVRTDRTLIFGGINTYQANFTASTGGARFELGHYFNLKSGRLTPYARFQALDVGTPNYAETTLTGSPSFALSYTSKNHFDYQEAGAVEQHPRVGSHFADRSACRPRLAA
jgi:hypothetical protein